MSDNLPPGCSDKDVEASSMGTCEECGAPCDGELCKKCARRQHDMDDFDPDR